LRKSVTNAYSDSDSSCQRNTDVNGYCNRYCHCHCNSDCHADADRLADTKDYTNSEGASDSSASALMLADTI